MQIDPHKDYTFFQARAQMFDQAMAKGITPERVPVYAQLHEFAMNQVGAKAREFYSTPDLLTYAHLEISAEYGLDMPYVDYDCYNIEAEAMGQAMIFSDEDMPDVDRNQPFVTGPEDLERIKTPDFDNAGRCTRIIEAQQIFLEKTGLQPTLGFCAPFSFAANIRGIEPLIFDMLDEPGFANKLFTRVTEEIIAPWIRYQQKYFPTATSIAGNDATASPPIVTTNIIRKWITPYILRLQELCGPSVYVPNWVGEARLKNPTEMLDLKLEVTPKFIKGQDPDVEKLGPELYVAYAQEHDVPLILGVGASFLALSKPEEIYKRVKYYLEVGKQHDRFALYLCNLGATTPPENVRAAIDAIRIYGVY